MADVAEDVRWMRRAIELAERAAREGEVPVGAVVVVGGAIVGEGWNRREQAQDPVAHAEILAIQAAARSLKSWRLLGATLYVSLEPCAMCGGAVVNSRIERLVYGASDPKAGFCGSLGDLVRDERLNHRVEVVQGVLEQECGDLLRGFFQRLRG